MYVIFNDQSFKNILTKDIVSFEQLGNGLKVYNSDRVVSLENVSILRKHISSMNMQPMSYPPLKVHNLKVKEFKF